MENSGIGGSFLHDHACIITFDQKPTNQEAKVNQIINEEFSKAHKTDVITKKDSINNLLEKQNANKEIEETDIIVHRNSIKTLLKGQNGNNEIEQEETIKVPVYNVKGELVEMKVMTKSEYDTYFNRKVFEVKRENYEKNDSLLDTL